MTTLTYHIIYPDGSQTNGTYECSAQNSPERYIFISQYVVENYPGHIEFHYHEDEPCELCGK